MATQVLANSPFGGPVEGEGGFFALKASDSSATGHGVVGVSAAVDVLGDMKGSSPLDTTRVIAGVFGISDLPAGFGGNTAGVLGQNFTDGTGVWGASKRGMGVHGVNDAPGGSTVKPEYGCGVWGESANGYGVFGSSANNKGVVGRSVNDVGIDGYSTGKIGVLGRSDTSVGVKGQSVGWVGVVGESQGGNGVVGQSFHSAFAGIFANNEAGGIGIIAHGTPAGDFRGDVKVTGDISVSGDLYLVNKDIAERFARHPETNCPPGSVVVMGPDGKIRPCQQGSDRRVIGVVPAEGGRRPAIMLGASDDPRTSVPVALVGTVDCFVDADFGPIEVGDMLVASSTVGHAMKAVEAQTAAGAVIGKALTALFSGRGVVRLLLALR